MTNKVRALDEASIRQIAAGEVIERPASAVKELLENSIDAGSARIELELEAGGKRKIRVSDDGCGMSPADAELCLERHTTSKIQGAQDLERLSTFGFRGEALPSIGSISKLELITRSEEDPSGTAISVEAGRVQSKKECGRARGTTLEITDLFFNTPARLKFLKSDASEKTKTLRTFEEVALAHPGVSFKVISDGRVSADLPGRDQLLDRIGELWGEDFSEETLIPLHFQHPFLRIEGFVSNPQSHRPTKNYQLFYVNRRPIVSRLVTHALYESYRDCLPVGRHPAAVVFLQVDPAQVDVNVHPSKREVRFRNEPQIYESLVREIRARRSELSPVPGVFFSAQAGRSASAPAASFFTRPSMPYRSPGELPSGAAIQSGGAAGPAIETPVRPAHEASPNTLNEMQHQALPARLKENIRVLCQFSSLYALAEREGCLIIVDQHAASERVLYERFKEKIVNGSPAGQALLLPVIWNVTLPQAEILKAHAQTFRSLGFVLEEFGPATFRITECPSIVPERELQKTLEEIVASIEKESEPSLVVEASVIRSACRGAVKANDRLSNRELDELLGQLANCKNPHTCPHGRPITLTLSRAELDKKFGRT